MYGDFKSPGLVTPWQHYRLNCYNLHRFGNLVVQNLVVVVETFAKIIIKLDFSDIIDIPILYFKRNPSATYAEKNKH